MEQPPVYSLGQLLERAGIIVVKTPLPTIKPSNPISPFLWENLIKELVDEE